MSRQPGQPVRAFEEPNPSKAEIYMDVRRSLNSELNAEAKGQAPLNLESSRHPKVNTTNYPPRVAARGNNATGLSSNAKVAILALVIALVLVLAYLGYEHGGKMLGVAYDKFISVFEYLATFREPWRTLILTMTSYLVQILGIPIFCVVCMIVSFCYGSYLIGFAVCMTVCVLSNITLYFVMMKAHETIFADDPEEEALLNKNRQLQFHEFIGVMMKEYIEEFPMQFGFAFRSMHLPDYAKMFIITKYKATLPQMLIPCLCVDSLNVFLYCFIGSQVQNKFDFFSSKAFHEKSVAEKIVSIISAVLIILQIAILIVGYIYTKRKYALYQAERAESSTNFHSDGQDDAVQPTGSILVPAQSNNKCIPQEAGGLRAI